MITTQVAMECFIVPGGYSFHSFHLHGTKGMLRIGGDIPPNNQTKEHNSIYSQAKRNEVVVRRSRAGRLPSCKRSRRHLKVATEWPKVVLGLLKMNSM